MRKITISIVLLTMASLAVFAAGSAEDTASNTMPWAQGRGQYQSGVVISEDITKVTGTLKLIANGHSELVADGETYELLYPYRLSYNAGLKDGMEITVEGFEAENIRFDNDEATKNLMVQSATIDGRTYNIAESMENYFGGYGRMAMGNGYNDMPMGRGGRFGGRSGHMGGNFLPRGDSQNNFFGMGRR